MANEKITQKCKVVMLPQDKKGAHNKDLILCITDMVFYDSIGFGGGSKPTYTKGELYIADKQGINVDNFHWQSQHLYFTSDEEIFSDNEWRICKFDNSLVYVSKGECAANTSYIPIVASTDPSLGLPAIQQSFIEKYVAAQGKIEEVEIEWHHDSCPYGASWEPQHEPEDYPKLTKDNEVIVIDNSKILKEVAEKLKDKVLFPESLARANSILSKTIFPKKSKPEALKEAADTYSGLKIWINKQHKDDSEFYEYISSESFKSGAEWQKVQSDKTLQNIIRAQGRALVKWGDGYDRGYIQAKEENMSDAIAFADWRTKNYILVTPLNEDPLWGHRNKHTEKALTSKETYELWKSKNLN